MKSLLLIISLLVSTVMSSSNSLSGLTKVDEDDDIRWTRVGESEDEDTYYVDYGSITEHSGFVYYWTLIDYLKPDKDGTLSHKTYNKGDCKLSQFKFLSFSSHKEPKGGGTGEAVTLQNPKWVYPSPKSQNEGVLKIVCRKSV